MPHRPSSPCIRLAALPFLLLALAVPGQTFQPMADAYTYDANPSVNYGTTSDIVIKKGTTINSRKGYLAFDLEGQSFTGVTGAVLRLCTTTAVALGVNLYEVDNGWTETGITWNNAPAAGGIIAGVQVPATPGYVEWDVTSVIQAHLGMSSPMVSFMVFPATTSSAVIRFNSREAQSGRPELVITTLQVPPADPTDLVVTSASPGWVKLAWEDRSGNESGFRIERRSGSGPFAEIATTGPGTTAYTDCGLPGGTVFIYRVRAFNGAGNSGYSNEVQVSTPSAQGLIYYVDALNGNDQNNGLSPSAAWQTLGKVNSVVFSPGSRILFKAGQAWTGRLYPKGSGSPGNPVVIDMYGTGAKPLINGNGMTGTGVVYLYNQQHWEISNLEITNDAATGGDRRGVRIEAENYGTACHIWLRNLLVHNVKGLVGQGRPEKRTSGIGFAIVSAGLAETHFDSILIEDCVIHSCENQGIITECVDGDGFDPYSPEWNAIKITNAVIRNNTIYNISKNAMIIRLFEYGVVERNVCYNTANGITGNTMFTASCYGTVFQFNEGYDNHSPDADGSMYDADLRSPGTVWQYSYSHDNAHGLFWTCTVQADADVVCRYNISQNDRGIIFCINYPVTSVHVYNNTVYCPPYLSPVIISERNNGGSGSRTYTFRNNLIYNLSTTATYGFTSGYNRTIDYNCFYGIHPSSEPADPHKVTADPKLVNAGSGGTGTGSVNGYKTTAGSSCINAGTVIPSNGGRDYWGNELYNGLPDIGAYEYPEKTSTGGNWSQPGTWTPQGVPTGTSNVTILAGVVTVDTPAAVCNALSIESGAGMQAGHGKKLLVRGDLSRRGQESFVVSPGAVMTNSGEIEIRRNLTFPTAALFQAGPGAILLGGTVHQYLSGSFSTGTLAVGNPAGCTLGGTVRTDSMLSLQNGRIRTGSWDIVMGPASALSGTPSAGAMIVTNGPGQVIREAGTGFTGGLLFPLGDMNGTVEYSPLTLQINEGITGTGISVGARVVNSPFPNPMITGNYLARYWNMSTEGGSFRALLDFSYLPDDVTGDETLLACSRVDPSPLATFGTTDTLLHRLAAGVINPSGSFTGIKSTTVFPNQQVSGITVENSMSVCFDASDTLIVGGDEGAFTVLAGGHASLVAGSLARIAVGTVVHYGGSLTARITPDGNYCFSSPQALPAAGQESSPATALHDSEPGDTRISVYPNPTCGTLTLEAGGYGIRKISRIVVYDFSGRVVISQVPAVPAAACLDLTGFPNGIYFARVCFSEGSVTARIIKI